MASNFEKVMQACLESKKTPAKKAVNSKKTIKKTINESKRTAPRRRLREEFEEDEVDVDVDVDDDGVMDDVVDDVVVVVDPELDAEDVDTIADELQDIVDDTPEGEVPFTDEYIGDYTYGCPICGSNFFSDTEMHAGDECPVCGETPDDFVLAGQVAEDEAVVDDEDLGDEDFADEEGIDDVELDVETPDEDLEADVDEEELENFRRMKRNSRARKENRRTPSRRSNVPQRRNTGYSLDESTFNPFLTKFIRENYKNARSFVMKRATYNKATKDLRVECLIAMKNGKTKKATLKFEKFNPNNKILAAKDASRTFKCESRNIAPFKFKVSCRNKVIKCEGLKYNYVTKGLKENARLQVSGNLIKESRKNPTQGRRVK